MLYPGLLRIFALSCVASGLSACGSSVPLNNTPVPPPRVLAPVIRVEPAAVVRAFPVPPAASPAFAFAPPASGPTVARFDGRTRPGISIEGRAGDPVFASREGRVVLVSSALAAYGTMIVVKHDDIFITAYAHLGKTLVKENDEVRQGQPIAEMGGGRGDRAHLHFEIRKMGVAVDPEPYLLGIAH